MSTSTQQQTPPGELSEISWNLQISWRWVDVSTIFYLPDHDYNGFFGLLRCSLFCTNDVSQFLFYRGIVHILLDSFLGIWCFSMLLKMVSCYIFISLLLHCNTIFQRNSKIVTILLWKCLSIWEIWTNLQWTFIHHHLDLNLTLYPTCFFTYLSIYASFYPSINLSCYLDTNIWIHFEIVWRHLYFLPNYFSMHYQPEFGVFCGSFISFEVEFSYNEMNKSEVYDLRLTNAYTRATQIPTITQAITITMPHSSQSVTPHRANHCSEFFNTVFTCVRYSCKWNQTIVCVCV